MEYLDLLAAYNREKKPLLIQPIIEKNLPSMSPVQQEMYFLDPRFYNLKLSKEKNLEVKKKMASYLNYNGTIVSGAVKDGILFTWVKGNIVDERYVFYILGGLPEKETGSFNHKYVFYDNTYVDKLFIGNTLFHSLTLPYTTTSERLSRLLDKNSKILGKYFSALFTDEYGNWYFICKNRDIISAKILDLLEKFDLTVQIELSPQSDTLVIVK